MKINFSRDFLILHQRGSSIMHTTMWKRVETKATMQSSWAIKRTKVSHSIIKAPTLPSDGSAAHDSLMAYDVVKHNSMRAMRRRMMKCGGGKAFTMRQGWAECFVVEIFDNRWLDERIWLGLRRNERFLRSWRWICSAGFYDDARSSSDATLRPAEASRQCESSCRDSWCQVNLKLFEAWIVTSLTSMRLQLTLHFSSRWLQIWWLYTP